MNKNAPTIIFCNPNACTYEYINLQSEYLRFYVENGYNIVVWNYRGYGRTKRGWCNFSMQTMQKDGLAVVKHVKENVVSGKVGVHGVSLGGSIANYIASKLKLDFAFIDRSFQSLQSIAYWFGGRAILWVFRIFTFGGWPDHSL